MIRRCTAAVLPLLALLPLAASASCGAGFCPVNTQWEVLGAWQEPGLRMDLRYEFLDQDQPRQGRDKVSVGQIPAHHDEVRTLNRNWLLGLDYSANARWGVSLTLPLVNRDHSHIHNHHGAQLHDAWELDGLGDARLLGRYRLEGRRLNLLLCLKLPTGDTGVANAAGDPAEPSLQPGTGTTDLLLGAAYRQADLRSPWTWFAQGLAQQPLAGHEGYRPGRRLTLDLGLHYAATRSLGLQAQLNGLIADRDQGERGEPRSTAGEYVFL